MAAYISVADSEVAFSHDLPKAAEIIRNVKNIIATPKGTMPGTRAFGLNQDFIDQPGPVAMNMLAVELSDELEAWEPRADVDEINMAASEDGSRIYPVITLSEGDEIDADESGD